MFNVPLKVPLGLFNVGGFLQRNHTGATRVQVFGKALNRSALTSGVAPLKDDQDFLARGFCPQLELQKLNLQGSLFFLVGFTPQFRIVRIADFPGVALIVVFFAAV